MQLNRPLIFASLAILLLLASCGSEVRIPQIDFPAPGSGPGGTSPGQPSPPQELPSEDYGMVEGRICFPSEVIPAMTAYFSNIKTGQVVELPVSENQTGYQVSLPAGMYIAYAWLVDADLGGSYSNAVPCGLTVECTDHLPVAFDVLPGDAITGIDICDWYAPLEDLPALPNKAQSVSANLYPELTGLVFSTGAGLEQIDAVGGPVQISDEIGLLSPSGLQMLVPANEDIWLVDLQTGLRTNITNTPNRVEMNFQWWPARADTIVFTSYAKNDEASSTLNGFLTAVRLDGSDYRVLDDRREAGSFSLAPDGQRIAYGSGQAGYLYDWDGEVYPFAPSDYAGAPSDPQQIGSPAWSPDGSRLAWVWDVSAQGGVQTGIGIFDLETKTASPQLLPTPALDWDGWPPAPIWSPDGRWIAYQAFSLTAEESGLWLVQAQPPYEERRLGISASLAWRPDGQALAFIQVKESQAPLLSLLHLEDWSTLPLNLPENIYGLWWNSQAPSHKAGIDR